MEAVSAGASNAGGRVVGVTAPAVFPSRSGANDFVSEEMESGSLTERIHDLTRIATATITLHGSLGTLTELMVAWNLAFVARFSREMAIPVVAVGPHWRTIIDSLATALDTDRSLVTSVETVDEAVAVITSRILRQS